MKTPRFKPVKTEKGWRLNVPAALSSNNKRVREFYSTREKADGRATELRSRLVAHGRSACVLPPAQADAAARAFALLGPDRGPEVLLQAVQEFVERHNVRTKSIPFEEAFERFQNYDSARRSPSYVRSLRQYRKRLSTLHGRLLCDITANDIEQAMLNFPPSVFNFGLRILGGVFRYGAKKNMCTGNPIINVDRKQLDTKEVRIYTPAQVGDLLSAAEPALLPWLVTCMFAGVRGSEARQLRWADFDFAERFVRVPSSVSKTRQPRAIPMENALEKWLLPYRGSNPELIAPQGSNVIRKQMRGAHKASGVARIKHGPRHSYASYLLARDGSIDALLLNMGHTEADTTFKHYTSKLATKRDAAAFWSILPYEDSEKIVAIAGT